MEGTAAQYTWMVQHNPAGLFAAMGGRDKALDRLDTFFHNADGSWAFTGSGGDKSELDNEPSDQRALPVRLRGRARTRRRRPSARR